jgi:multidrug efflux pump
VIYRQFSLTIVAAMALSVMVALILSPALTATVLKRPEDEDHHSLVGRASHWMRVRSTIFRQAGGLVSPRADMWHPQAPPLIAYA